VNRHFQNRCLILCAVLVTGLSLLSVRLIQIQLVDRQIYANKARKAYHQVERLPAMRGMIVDRLEQPLARSSTVTTIFVNRNHLLDPNLASVGLAYQIAQAEPDWQDRDARSRRSRIAVLRDIMLKRDAPEVIVEKNLAYAISILASPLRMRGEDLRAKIEGPSPRVKEFAIVKDWPEDLAEPLREELEKHRIEGFIFRNSIKRSYLCDNLATHVTGFTGEPEETDEDGKTQSRIVGRFGVESAMEEYLAGRDGRREHRRDSSGQVVPGNSNSLFPPRAGMNVQLTLDMGIQSIVEEELDAAMAEFDVERAAVVLMEPKTGEILAMASRPHFNLNRRENVPKHGWIHYAIQAINEPGSTIKIVAAAAALNEKLVNPQTSIFCHNGSYKQGSVVVKDDYPASYLTVEGILQKSNNIGAFMLAQQVGMRRFYGYVEDFGFGKKTGVLLNDESRGIVRNFGSPADFSRTSYGYALSVTPLQLASAYSVIANGGKLMRPHIVKAIIANDGTVVERFEPEVVREVIKTETAKQMRAALQRVSEIQGTGTRAAVPGFDVAGKTGTAEKVKESGRGYHATQRVVSFAGMMPAQDPAFVCVVVLDNPRTTTLKRSGGLMAAPVFQKIATRVATRMDLQPTRPIPTPVASSPTR
jgi:cell division protein FtsI/penicillin-binding protein 2